MTGIEEIAAERKRQIEQEGWTAEHDAGYVKAEMVMAAVAYASHAGVGIQVTDHKPDIYKACPAPKYWPWLASWWKPTSPRRDLVKAGALIAAEIDRIDATATLTK